MAYSLNDHDMMYASIIQWIPMKSSIQTKSISSSGSNENLEFQVPNLVEKRRVSRLNRLKELKCFNGHGINAGKDELFINESEMLQRSQVSLEANDVDPIKEALKLLNGPEELFVSETFDGIFKTSKLNFSYSTNNHKQNTNLNNQAGFNADLMAFNDNDSLIITMTMITLMKLNNTAMFPIALQVL